MTSATSSLSPDEDAQDESLDLFREPADFYQAQKEPTFVNYRMKDGHILSLRLIGHSPLWGHLLWNAGQVMSAYIEDNSERLVKGKTILELGAGAGLPSLVCALHDAKQVVVTDYPDADLIANLQFNIERCGLLRTKDHIRAEGYLWGNPVDALQQHLDQASSKFDILILADILFNHSEHQKLVNTMRAAMKNGPDAVALVFFTPYRPWLLEKDLHFFDLARTSGFAVTKILDHTMEKVMFEDDPGDELLRRTVFGYELRWAALGVSEQQMPLAVL